MAKLIIPDKNKTLHHLEDIKAYLLDRGIRLEQWNAKKKLQDSSTQEEILAAYEHEVGPFMRASGFKSADVISVSSTTPNIETIRQKFLKEHTHSEDEVRFFVDGEGYFWFHLENRAEIICVHCVAGDFLSVPAGFKHWFDLAPKYSVKAIRIFTNVEGWVANYTGSGVEKKYIRDVD